MNFLLPFKFSVSHLSLITSQKSKEKNSYTNNIKDVFF